MQTDAERRDQAVEDWYNASTKDELIQWATDHKVDIGQRKPELYDDWAVRVMDAYAVLQD